MANLNHLFRKMMRLFSVFFLFILAISKSTLAQSASDSMLVSQWLLRLDSLKKTASPDFSTLLIEAGRLQIGTKYEAGLLDIPKQETLIVTTKGADCVLFIENAAAAALAVNDRTPQYSDFKKWLQILRYRNGKIDGYASRKHYFTEWMLDLVTAGKMTWISSSSAKPLQEIGFMSSRTELYQKISSKRMLDEIRMAEAKINRAKLTFIPKESIREVLPLLQTGDVLGFVTTVNGLDVSHTAIFIRENGLETFMHASTKGSVMIEPGGLTAYLAGRKSISGIIVGRFKS